MTSPEPRRGDPRPDVRASGALAFVVEIAMLVLLGQSGWAIGGSVVLSLVLAVALVGAAVVVWGVLLAPTAERRLRRPERLAVKAFLYLVTAAVATLAGYGLWAAAFLVVAVVSLVWARD
ncbi:DUF2568 domain-containing protein [Luteimicrobium subarcticum]|uniref:Uncharacterized protein DUF2568 n=1 Tax=Luteimicrobium subarcticum TaxID=620910 RepID=A0A2M8WS83_9MICO|nr:DUF2568 domain-containing protein [Luteimicrobium subarcticum]PJI93812.1 uncharacterized protein DUF2568 [Luteimicrobium subarcticum]